MAKQTVNEVLTEIAAKVDSDGKKTLNRFNRKNFNKLVEAVASDPDFKAQVAQIKKGEFDGYKDVAVGESFRKWVRGIVERAGVDSKESEIVASEDFPMGDMGWMYDFFAEVLWLYMQGSKFDIPKKENFAGATLSLKDVEETITTGKKTKPGGEVLGVFETTKKAHVVMKVKSGCPPYMVYRKKVADA